MYLYTVKDINNCELEILEGNVRISIDSLLLSLIPYNCRSVLLLEAIAKSLTLHVAITFKSD